MDKRINEHRCSQMELLIMEATLRPLKIPEQIRLDEHLSTCPSCSGFRKMVHEMSRTMEMESVLKPDPEIYQKLQTRLKESEPKSEDFAERLFRGIRNLFSYRIPVYQVALATAIIFAAILINHLSLPVLNNTGIQGTVYDTTESVRKWLFIERQADQNAIKADTILTRIINPSL